LVGLSSSPELSLFLVVEKGRNDVILRFIADIIVDMVDVYYILYSTVLSPRTKEVEWIVLQLKSFRGDMPKMEHY